MTNTTNLFATVLASCLLAAATTSLRADSPLERVTFTDKSTDDELTIEGRILFEGANGGVLLEDRSLELWSVTSDHLRSRETLQQHFRPFDGDQLGEYLQSQLGDQFSIVESEHYVLCTSADQAYAEWVGRLFERLQHAFLDMWQRAGLELHTPAAPLPAIVFATRAEYQQFATQDAGPQLADAAGYYSIRRNRIVLYDLTSDSDAAAANSVSEVNRRMRASPDNVATIVHEATHQIAFNCGMHTRYADNPMWLLEGMAMYCETPDLRSASGWKSIGKLNLRRLNRFRRFAESRRSGDSLLTLITSEDRFRDPELAADAYAESWALTYYLIRDRREQLITYLQSLASKQPLRRDNADTRAAEFTAAFGDLDKLETDFLRYIRRAGRR